MKAKALIIINIFIHCDLKTSMHRAKPASKTTNSKLNPRRNDREERHKMTSWMAG